MSHRPQFDPAWILRLLIIALLATVCGGGKSAATPAFDAPALPIQPERPGRHVRFEHFTAREGLSQSVVQVILQDRTGFIWIGAEDGLNRFDGYNFKIYRYDPGDPHSVSNSTILSLYEDPSGVLWIGTYGGGLNRFNPQMGRFAYYRHDPADPNSLSHDKVSFVRGDRAGVLWISTYGGGLNRFDPRTGRWRAYRHDPNDPDSLADDSTGAILEDSTGALWVATGKGLDRFDRENGRFIHYRRTAGDGEDVAAGGLSSNEITALYEDRAGALWVGTSAGLNRLDRGGDTFIQYRRDPSDAGQTIRRSLSNDVIRAILEDSGGDLWIATNGGLDRFERETGRFFHYQHDPRDPDSLSSDEIIALYEDRSGGLWIGTYGGGLNRFDRRGEQFAHYQGLFDDPGALSSNLIWSIFEDSAGTLWVGTHDGGLNRLDPQAGSWRHYRHSADDPRSLSHDQVWSIYEDRAGRLWVGTDDGLDRFEPASETFTHYRPDPQSVGAPSHTTIWDIAEDGQGVMWIGANRGLGRFDRETGRFTFYQHDPADPGSLSDNCVWVIYEDRAGTLWVGTTGGLNRFDRETERFRRYLYDPDDPTSVSSNSILSIYEDQAGNLWIGASGGGLNRFDRQSETFTHYWVKDGLPSDVIYGILEDDTGHLWLSTNNGVSKFNPQIGAFENYGVRDGLQSVEFNLGAYFESRSGEMFFGGINGLNAFYPGQISDNPYIPPIVLTEFSQGGEPLYLDMTAPRVTFKWPDNDFEFEFAALSYFQAEQNQYAYMLDGYDRNWNYVGERRFGQYTNLPGGVYTLRLKGSNNNGVWNEEGISVQVTIMPPFWATGWFRGVVALLLVGGAAAGYRLRIRSIQARSRELEERVTARTRDLATLNAVATVMSQSLHLDYSLGEALRETLQAMGVEAGGIYLLDEREGTLRLAAQRGFSPQFVAEIDRLEIGEGLSGHVVQSGQPLIVRDVSQDPRLTRSAVREEGLRSVAVVPLNSKGKGLGTLFAATHGDREFSASDVQLLTSIGNQIGVAVENARLFESHQRRAEQFHVINEVGRRITSILDIDEILTQVVQMIHQTFGYDHVGIALVEGDEAVYRVGAGILWSNPQFHFQPARLKVGKAGITGWVAGAGEPLLVPDVSREPRYVWMEGSATRSEMATPIKIKGEVIGVLDAQSNRLNAFDETDLIVLQSLAHQTGVAIENARLFERAQQAAVAQERSRLARDLHDAVTQTLFSASLIAEALGDSWERAPEEGRRQLGELRQLTRGALAEMRTLLLELRPAVLLEAKLGDLLHQLADAVAGRDGLPITVTVEGECELPSDVHVAFYRIAQEALNNISKHARANRVTVALRCLPASPAGAERQVELCISDDGRGFDPASVHPNRLGLGIMQERAQAVGARLEITSAPGQGTSVQVVWRKE